MPWTSPVALRLTTITESRAAKRLAFTRRNLHCWSARNWRIRWITIGERALEPVARLGNLPEAKGMPDDRCA